MTFSVKVHMPIMCLNSGATVCMKCMKTSRSDPHKSQSNGEFRAFGGVQADQLLMRVAVHINNNTVPVSTHGQGHGLWYLKSLLEPRALAGFAVKRRGKHFLARSSCRHVFTCRWSWSFPAVFVVPSLFSHLRECQLCSVCATYKHSLQGSQDLTFPEWIHLSFRSNQIVVTFVNHWSQKATFRLRSHCRP